MNQKKYNLYSEAILSVYPDACDIREPSAQGTLRNVLFAKTNQGERVFKFADEDLVLKNAKVSYLYKIRKIPAPHITPREYKKLHFEDYEQIQGITLHEAINDGIGENQIKSVYRDVIDLLHSMERIWPECLGKGPMHNAHVVAGNHLSRTHGLLMGMLANVAVYIANNNNGAKFNKGIFHFDLGPNNILLDNNGNLKALLDMDSVGICSQTFAFGMMAAWYKQIGMDITDLFKYYNTLTSDGLDYNTIKLFAAVRCATLNRQKQK